MIVIAIAIVILEPKSVTHIAVFDAESDVSEGPSRVTTCEGMDAASPDTWQRSREHDCEYG